MANWAKLLKSSTRVACCGERLGASAIPGDVQACETQQLVFSCCHPPFSSRLEYLPLGKKRRSSVSRQHQYLFGSLSSEVRAGFRAQPSATVGSDTFGVFVFATFNCDLRSSKGASYTRLCRDTTSTVDMAGTRMVVESRLADMEAAEGMDPRTRTALRTHTVAATVRYVIEPGACWKNGSS